MLRPSDLPRPLRRAANRPGGPRGRRPSAQLQAAADIGIITRSNTRPGTAGRRAVDAVVYRRRVVGRGEGVTARMAAGHETLAARQGISISVMLAGRGFVELEGLSRSERRRAARWNARAGELLAGQISRARFRRLVGSWAPLSDGSRFESTPDVVVSVLAERGEAGESLFEYRGRRS